MVNRDIEEIELDVEKYRMRLEEKRSIISFENAFFIPLFAILVLLSLIKTKTEIIFYLFLLAIVLIIIDLLHSIVIYKRLDTRSKLLDAIIKSKIRKLHG